MIRALALLALAGPAAAEIVVPVRTIPPQAVIGAGDLAMSDGIVPGAVAHPDEVVGLEARVALYAGRPIRAGDVALPAVVERNQVVPLVFRRGAVVITAEGRALDRAGPGDVIRVMNVESRTTVSARVGADGMAYVSD